MRVKVWYRIEVTGYTEVEIPDEDVKDDGDPYGAAQDAAEDLVENDTPISELIAGANLDDAIITGVEAQ